MEAQERQYSLRRRHPERDVIYADYAARSDRLRAAMTNWRALQYLPPARCGIDWYPPQGAARGAPAPLLVFLHGGFWRALDRRQFGFLAEPFVDAGIGVAMIGYELAPAVTLERIVDQVREGMTWLNRRAGALGFDPGQVVVAGHSAGGHLAAMLAATEPAQMAGLPLRGVVPISGIFALAPLLLTSINLDVRLHPADALRLSPQRLREFHAARFLMAVGELETEGFIQQSRTFGAALEAEGFAAQVQLVPQRHHFDILEDMADAAAPLHRWMRALWQTEGAATDKESKR